MMSLLSDEIPFGKMSPAPICPTDVELLKRLLLDMGQQRSVENVLKLVVDRLASQPNAALARIWLVAPGDICDNCHSHG